MPADTFHITDCTHYFLGQRINFIISVCPEGQTESVKVYIGGFYHG